MEIKFKRKKKYLKERKQSWEEKIIKKFYEIAKTSNQTNKHLMMQPKFSPVGEMHVGWNEVTKGGSEGGGESPSALLLLLSLKITTKKWLPQTLEEAS